MDQNYHYNLSASIVKAIHYRHHEREHIGNTTDNSGGFSLIRMHWLQQGHEGSKTLLQQRTPVLN